jgi:hypothetical protein
MGAMGQAVKVAWTAHPWVTGVEGLVALLLAAELVLVAHMLLGWLVGLLTHNPDAFDSSRFIFMTGQDAQFFAGWLTLLALIPAALALTLFGAIGWVHAHVVSAQSDAFVHATLFGGVTLVAALALLFAGGNVFGGGIIPH